MHAIYYFSISPLALNIGLILLRFAWNLQCVLFRGGLKIDRLYLALNISALNTKYIILILLIKYYYVLYLLYNIYFSRFVLLYKISAYHLIWRVNNCLVIDESFFLNSSILLSFALEIIPYWETASLGGFARFTGSPSVIDERPRITDKALGVCEIQ